jgi:hypothetical protein
MAGDWPSLGNKTAPSNGRPRAAQGVTARPVGRGFPCR